MATTEPNENGSTTAEPKPKQLSTKPTEPSTTVSEPDSSTQPSEEQPAAAANATQVPAEKKWPGWPGYCVFRIIVPVLKVGSIIGRKGELIKKMCEETRARVRVLDAPLGTPDRVVSSYYR